MVNTSDILPNTPRYLKVPLIFFNAVLWILGVILIALGAWALNQLKSVDSLGINVTLPSGLVVLGVFLIILTVVGCVVAYKENLVGLIVYTVVILILLICLIGVGGAAFSYRGDAGDLLHKAWTKADPGIQGPLERVFSCCGWNNETSTYAEQTLKDGTPCLFNKTVVNPTPAPTSAPTEAPTTAPTSAPTAAPTSAPTEAPTTTTTTAATTAAATTAATTATATTAATAATTTTTSASASTSTSSVSGGLRSDFSFVFDFVMEDNNTTNGNNTIEFIPNYAAPDCGSVITNYVSDRLYVAGVAGVVIGVIEFVCMLFSLFLIVRLCRNPSSRSYD